VSFGSVHLGQLWEICNFNSPIFLWRCAK